MSTKNRDEEMGKLINAAFDVAQQRAGKQAVEKILGKRAVEIKGKRIFFNAGALADKTADELSSLTAKVEKKKKK